MLQKLHKALFFVFIFALPLNLAKRFIFSWSYADGILIDYLIPTLYATDILIALILFVWDIDILVNRPKYSFKASVPLLFLSLLFFGILLSFSVSYYPSIYKIIRIMEMLLLFIYVGLNFDLVKGLENVSLAVCLSVLFESCIGFIQFIKRSSVFNNYLFFGEHPYSFKTPGVVYESFFGNKIIPSHGTFPHPNVFGGFLSLYLVTLLYFLAVKKVKFLYVTAFLYGVLVLLLTFSFTAIAALILGALLLISYKIRGKTAILVISIVTLAFAVLSPLFLLSVNENKSLSIARRNDLFKASLRMIVDRPLFGIGLNMFPVYLKDYGAVRGTIQFLQPVHNVLYLIAAESGIAAALVFVVFLTVLFYKSYTRGFSLIPLVLIIMLVFIGSFDHYIYTIQQGQLMFWLTLGMVFSTIVNNAGKNKLKS